MIPADHITIDKGTAWCAFKLDGPDRLAWWKYVDRPCDTCGGQDVRTLNATGWHDHCTDCGGTGRHTFEIEVPGNVFGWGGKRGDEPHTLRVSVVPGVVLPIVDSANSHDVPDDCIDLRSGGITKHRCGPVWEPVDDFPPAAKPGMWVVRLAVHRAR